MRLAATATVLLLLVTSLTMFSTASGADEPVVLVVGDLGQMTTRNPLRVSLSRYADRDDLGAGVLRPMHSAPVLYDPVTGELRPYIAKGIDADGDGAFEPDEYGVFAKDAGTNATDVTVYFDFNGVRWHDGTPVTAMDVLFSLHLASLNPRTSSPLRVLWDRAGAAGTNYTWTRWLSVGFAAKSWVGETSMAGDPASRIALRFRLQAPYARFYERTLGDLPLLPRHVWEGTGGGRHGDFGRGVYPEGDPRMGEGIPVNETLYRAFVYDVAEAWEPSDADVVGSGPYRFVSRIPGQSTRIERYGSYYVGADAGGTYDARLASSAHRPYVGAIVFLPYKTVQLGEIALRSGEIDYFRLSLPPEFVPDLLGICCDSIRIWAGSELGYTYLAYNMRIVPFGYSTFPPTSRADDVGLPFREAMAHLIDKSTIVRTLLQNYGVIADGPLSPANTFWYNGSLPKYPFDPAKAAQILDNAGWKDWDGDGWRELPGRGGAAIQILVPGSDYDYGGFVTGTMWAEGMRAVGLKVLTVPTALGAVTAALENGTFDLALASWSLLDPDPDYMFDRFHCSSAQSRNYPGYCDAEFDRVLELSRVEMNLAERQHLIRWAQGIVMGNRPVEPIFYETAIQATRGDRFYNWTLEFGSLWNDRSWMGVRPATARKGIRIDVAYDTAMASEGRQWIQATVTDDAGRPVVGATVTVRILPQDGGRFLESGGSTVSGTTGDRGTFGSTYEAPRVLDSLRDVGLEVVADHELALAPAQLAFLVTIFPGAVGFLSIRTSLPGGGLTMPGDPLPVHLDVRDETGFPAYDAQVRATVSPTNATLVPDRGTADEMSRILFTPPDDLGINLTYRISLVAERPGAYAGYANVTVDVIVLSERSVPPPGTPLEGDLALRAGIALGSTVAIVATLWVARRAARRRKPG